MLVQRCRQCKNTYPATGPTSHFKARRKSCRTCLEGLPPPLPIPAGQKGAGGYVVVVRRPRRVGSSNTTRWWPRFVRAHLPRAG